MLEDARVERIAQKVSQIISLSRQIDELINILSQKYLDREGGLVASIFKNIVEVERPPKLPESMKSNIYVLDKELDKYLNGLQEYVDKISRIALLLDRAERVERNLREEINETVKWSKILEQINPYYYSEAIRTINKYKRILESISTKDVKKFLRELEGYLEDLRVKNSFYKRICSKRIDELYDLCSLAVKLYGQARLIVGMDQIAILEEKIGEVRKIKKMLDEYMKDMSSKLDLREIRSRLMEIIGYFREIFTKTMDREKSEVLSTISMISKASEGKLLRLDELIEQVSRRTGYSREKVLETIYFLNKRNLLDIRIRIHY